MVVSSDGRRTRCGDKSKCWLEPERAPKRNPFKAIGKNETTNKYSQTTLCFVPPLLHASSVLRSSTTTLSDLNHGMQRRRVQAASQAACMVDQPPSTESPTYKPHSPCACLQARKQIRYRWFCSLIVSYRALSFERNTIPKC